MRAQPTLSVVYSWPSPLQQPYSFAKHRERRDECLAAISHPYLVSGDAELEQSHVVLSQKLHVLVRIILQNKGPEVSVEIHTVKGKVSVSDHARPERATKTVPADEQLQGQLSHLQDTL